MFEYTFFDIEPEIQIRSKGLRVDQPSRFSIFDLTRSPVQLQLLVYSCRTVSAALVR